MVLVTVVETPEFQRRARVLMGDEERHALIDFVAQDPEAGVSIGGGVRKFRFARQGGGKSGGYRVIHFFGGDDMPVFLLTVFAKNEKANLTPSETEAVRRLGAALAASYGRRE
ncbi:type II toxin-antitoxin system RelE/ParE family toxin [Pseudoruegeria sp. HB172150]|uniref:type II toxin-antitoxin system RelE/ParE family toxin n=1 Tax=Pseudoruegeria sp. HB172150 TaxID=2721164 RepID=UPI001C1316BD|nr:type II toxin-antitoxin system RelE/ParE family toxin [Pseudoruegeria sp. HB172150]